MISIATYPRIARRRKRRVWFAWLSCCLLLPVAAADARWHFERVGTESGPPPAVITAIYQDSTGLVWIGSRNGLLVYDGYSFSVLDHDSTDPDSISDNAIRTIYEDRAGSLWVGTNTGGLNRLDRSTWKFETYRFDSADARSISHDSVYSILEDHAGALWVGTQKGLNRMDPRDGTFERILADPSDPGGLSNDYIMTIYEDARDRLWVGTLGGGLVVLDRESGLFRSYRHQKDDPQTLTDDEVVTIVEDHSGALWVGTVRGLNRFDPDSGRVTRFQHDPLDPTTLSSALVTSIALGSPGTVWVGTHGGGLNELDTRAGTFRASRAEPSRPHSLGDNQVISLMADSAGTLWIGTWGGGLNRLTSSSMLFTGLSAAELLPVSMDNQDVTAMCHDRRDGLWIGTRTGYVFHAAGDDSPAEVLLHGGSEGVARIVLGLYEDRAGQVWIAANTALLRIDPQTGDTTEWVHDPTDPSSIGPGYVRVYLEDSHGQRWVGTGEGGLQRLDANDRVVERFVHDPGDRASLSDNYVTAIVEDAEGTLWVGTRSGGLNVFDRSTRRFVRYLPDAGNARSLSHHYVTSMLSASSGVLWVGTSGGGLNRVERSPDGGYVFRWFTENHGLADNDVMAILEDDDGSLWLSTKHGLSRLDPVSESLSSIHVSDGLPTAEFEPGAAARSADSLWFGSVRSVVRIPLGTPFPQSSASPTVITTIRTSGAGESTERPAIGIEEMDLPYGDWLALELAVLDYAPEQRHRYAYRLGEEWIDLGARRDITFIDLAPGLHEFSARGRNGQGVWSESSPFRIRVVPPFWMTWWFRATVLLTLLTLALAIHQRRLAVVEKRNRELMELHHQREKAQSALSLAYGRLRRLTRRLELAKEEERKRIARELHDDMGPALTAVIINLQLLPKHPDSSEASRRITDTIELVDRLVQRIRDLSLDLRPPLLDELGLLPALKGYLEAQSERTGLEIDVHGHVEGLPGETEIAAFRVIQEAVTNTIRHAKATRVDVTVRQRDGQLELTVTDDGQGFDVRDTMERASSGKALGLLGMQERVQVLDGEVEIDSSPGHPTEVRIRMPVEVPV